VFNDKYVITLGGADRCVFQWRHLEENEAEDSDDDEEDGKLHDQGKGSRAVLMVQTGMTMGEAEFEPLNASEGVPNPYKNHSLAELKAKRGYKAPIVGRPVMGQMRVSEG
jgi:microtubule-associated protein-like 6